jgi:hypothetical protein
LTQNSQGSPSFSNLRVHGGMHHPASQTLKKHLLAVSTKDIKIQIYPVNFASPFCTSTPISQFRVKNRKRTTALKFYKDSLFTFSSELVSVYDIE